MTTGLMRLVSLHSSLLQSLNVPMDYTHNQTGM